MEQGRFEQGKTERRERGERLERRESGQKPVRGRIMLLYMQRLGVGNLHEITEPLGLGCLAAFVEERGYAAQVYSGPLHDAWEAVQAEMGQNGLDALGLYCDFENQSAVESFSRKVKEIWPIRVFIGGPQAVALGKGFVMRSRCDGVVRGEGEHPLHRLLEFFLHGEGSLKEIPGLAYVDTQGEWASNPPGPPLRDLDRLPILKSWEARTSRRNSKNLAVLSGRGCPFHCAFCYEGSVPGKVRLRSVDHVIGEIRQALAHRPSIRYIWFADDTFTLDPRRMAEFSRALTELRKEHDFVWFCECHPSTLIRWPDMLEMMIEAGLVRMQIGIESGSAEVLALYRKQAGKEEIEKVVRLAMEKGLPQLTGNIIVGGAAESRETFEDTKRFAQGLLELGPGMVDITSTFFIPLPNTAISEDPGAFGLRLLDRECLTSIGDIAVVETESLTRWEITAMRMEFTRHVLTVMNGLYSEGKIPEERVALDFRLKDLYGIESNWLQLIYRRQIQPNHDDLVSNIAKNPFERNYSTMLDRGAARPSTAISPEELDHWRPQRVIELWTVVDESRGYPQIGGYVLSPLEYALLLYATGKLTRKEALERVYEQFGDRFDGVDDFNAVAGKILLSFEERYWLVYAPL
ncbi:radical SAM protein [Heliobacterium undosum]|uniref:Radical SAM protein n=1 Tax=Heliomicrobium undosum TaxID=121734 RepID=A0A845LA60_9FIRM|nr:radical SAM protein [Heliomicrobium undosum]MZP30588.1 radical SAM protein [Heliomicrobium undosum]